MLEPQALEQPVEEATATSQQLKSELPTSAEEPAKTYVNRSILEVTQPKVSNKEEVGPL